MTFARRPSRIIVVCDTCKAELSTDTGHTKKAQTTLEGKGWRATGSKNHICPKCQGKKPR